MLGVVQLLCDKDFRNDVNASQVHLEDADLLLFLLCRVPLIQTQTLIFSENSPFFLNFGDPHNFLKKPNSKPSPCNHSNFFPFFDWISQQFPLLPLSSLAIA